MKDYALKELIPLIERKLRAQGDIDAQGQVTQKGFDRAIKQYRALKAKRPN